MIRCTLRKIEFESSKLSSLYSIRLLRPSIGGRKPAVSEDLMSDLTSSHDMSAHKSSAINITYIFYTVATLEHCKVVWHETYIRAVAFSPGLLRAFCYR